ncbi:DUF2283 domain-containing protein [Gloeocapsopsis dulcis]|uniref:DUF2283 domain-containing protein n=1 Tax=Gloeocapsopsis dulcis AAB1 = 1H9 TaxID=1433147 RepID=A0A6N8FQQ3_9CHRO|nr:DUF2283 domain-containing protein [Gloeocapsopsis dulcis]MUL35510.1 hypothetical protein [Gloeocapsopsis dulcis AAB1 = 1H9]WNN87593.1 DUF2283 domain-containing protein [Gloeocapsopsis dulcis]
MKATYNQEDDVLWIRWSHEIDESDETEPGVIVDYDKQGNVVGLEILDASKRIKNFPQSVADSYIGNHH